MFDTHLGAHSRLTCFVRKHAPSLLDYSWHPWCPRHPPFPSWHQWSTHPWYITLALMQAPWPSSYIGVRSGRRKLPLCTSISTESGKHPLILTFLNPRVTCNLSCYSLGSFFSGTVSILLCCGKQNCFVHMVRSCCGGGLSE